MTRGTVNPLEGRSVGVSNRLQLSRIACSMLWCMLCFGSPLSQIGGPQAWGQQQAWGESRAIGHSGGEPWRGELVDLPPAGASDILFFPNESDFERVEAAWGTGNRSGRSSASGTVPIPEPLLFDRWELGKGNWSSIRWPSFPGVPAVRISGMTRLGLAPRHRTRAESSGRRRWKQWNSTLLYLGGIRFNETWSALMMFGGRMDLEGPRNA